MTASTIHESEIDSAQFSDNTQKFAIETLIKIREFLRTLPEDQVINDFGYIIQIIFANFFIDISEDGIDTFIEVLKKNVKHDISISKNKTS